MQAVLILAAAIAAFEGQWSVVLVASLTFVLTLSPVRFATWLGIDLPSIGALWEVFEFGMDQIFGMNMQKSGLVDTMGDLIVDAIGAGLAAMSGGHRFRQPFRALKGL